MKKMYSASITVFVLLIVIAFSGCTSSSNNSSSSEPTKTYSANGVSFNYPESWQVNDTASTIKVTNPQTQNAVLIMKSPIADMQTLANKRVETTTDKIVSDNNLTVNGVSAREITIDKDTTKEIVTYIQAKSDLVYSVTYMAPQSDFDSMKITFNTIVNSFKAQ